MPINFELQLYPGTIISIPFDGHKISGLLYNLNTDPEHLTCKYVVLRLHGVLGNLLDETEHYLPIALADAGYSSLTVNTLLANLGLFFGFGIFDDAMAQIDAAMNFLRGVGFKKIVVAGHGLGGCMAIRYAAMRSDPAKYPDFRGVIAIATPYSMPETTRRRWKRFGSRPSYEEVLERAARLFHPKEGEPPAEDEIVVIKRAHGTTDRPEDSEIYTLRTWWTLAGPMAHSAEPYRHIGKIRIPILLVHANHDEFIEHDEHESLGLLARRAGNGDVSQMCMDTDHAFNGKNEELCRLIIDWVDDTVEPSWL